MKSIKARKQRKEYFNAPIHKKRKWMAAHLEENLLLKYDLRRVPVVKGDTVRVMRGNFKGHEDKVSHINVRRRYVEVEGLTMTKADGKKIAKPIHASNLLITKLNLTDKWRREKLERELSEDIKKDIEQEAKEQIIKNEEEKKKMEEEKAEDSSKIKDETEDKIKSIEKNEGTAKKPIPNSKKVKKTEEKTKTASKNQQTKTKQKNVKKNNSKSYKNKEGK
jgi:large subunit ribosomal protein L24